MRGPPDMRKLVYLADARRDIGAAFDFQLEMTGDPDQAEKLAIASDAQCRKVARTSIMLGRPREALRKGLRSTPFGNYMIFFRYSADMLEIVNILHGRSDIEAMFQDKGEDPWLARAPIPPNRA